MKTEARTKERQYEACLEVSEAHGRARLGLMTNQVWHDDPKRLAFVLARYKFVSRMLSGLGWVLEIGCADAFATRIVQAAVGRVTAIDFDPVFIADICERMEPRWAFDVAVHDMLESPYAGPFDGAYSLDVLEHIEPRDEGRFVGNIAASLKPEGVAIIGMPSLNSQTYASLQSRMGHINCKQGEDLKVLLQNHFQNVFLFSMNDEVVHTGFLSMAHYYLALCCMPRCP